MTDHPCKGMSPRAVEVFERICLGESLPAMTKGVAAKLLAKGVIDHAEPKILRDSLGNYSIPQYFVPLLVHKQWCDWCSEQPDIEDVA